MFHRKEKFLLLVLALVQFNHIVDFMIVMPMGPQLMRVFEIVPQQFSYLVSSYSLAAGVTSLCSAFFIDRLNRRNALLFFYAGFGISTWLCSLAFNYPMMLVARSLTGAFGGVIYSLALSIVGDAIEPKRRATAMGILMTAYSLAAIFGVPCGLYLAQHISWQSPFVFLGCLSVFLFGTILRWIPPSTMHLQPLNRSSGGARVLAILKNPSQVMSLVFVGCLVLSQFSLMPFLSMAMIYNGGLPESKLALIFLVSGFSSILFAPLIGKLADTYGKIKVFYISAVASVLPISIVTTLDPTPTWLLLTIILVFFATMTGRMIPAIAIANSTATTQNRAGLMSLGSSVQQFAQAAAAVVAGAIVVQSPSGPLMNYSTVGIFSIVFTNLAILAATRIVAVDGSI